LQGDIQVLNEKVIQNKENNNYYLNPTENQSIDENEEEIVTKVNSKVLLKFFELLTKSFLGTNRVPSVVESVPSVGSDSDDFYEALMNSFASTNNNKAPVTNSSIKLLKKNNNIGEEKIKSTDKNNTSIQEEEQEEQDSITDVIQSLMKKIISFFGKRNQLKHKRETKAYVRSILKKAILKKKKKLENKV
jgi:hypothetical protein